MKYPHHPLANCFPLLSQEEQAAEAPSIAEHGLYEDIVLHDGHVLDGRNRQIQCEIAGVEPRYREFGSRPSDGVSPAAFVLSLNSHRRHLSTEQRAAAAAELRPFFAAELEAAGGGDGSNGGGTEHTTKGAVTETLARELKVSPRTIADAETVKETDPEGFQEMKEGKTSVAAATKKAKKKTKEAAAASANPLLDGLREKAAREAKERHGDDFAAAILAGEGLTTADELADWSEMKKTDQKPLVPLLMQGYTLTSAIKFAAKELDGHDRIEALLNKARAAHGKFTVNIAGFTITVKQQKEEAEAPEESPAQ